ncbi:hypothetical protein GN958_ATG05711 [Phytophthora infestans]|uniref:Secreted protein n=1 Tax=Phytophthora infestans TaxID=4787 RepID=A0A8S9V3V5_PHYIN|nr:hypothetical protein GN958_ATG21623 [Phytophthora infestans]KAF4145128.1 hypothetical protein GN958_ATG05711 [Phytophthora infestans]
MAPHRFSRSSALLLSATLAVTSSAIDFSRPDDSLAPGAVLPGGETPTADAATENTNSPMQWEASSSGFVPVTAPIVTSRGSGGWSQPTTPDTPSVWMPSSGHSSGTSNLDWIPPYPSSDGNNVWTSPTSSESGDHASSGSVNQGRMPTRVQGSGKTTPTTSYESDEQGSLDTPTSGGAEEAAPATSVQGPSQATQISPTASSSSTESSSNTTPSSNADSTTTTTQSTASPSSTTQEGSDTTQNSTSTSEHAPFGKVTSKPGECVIGNPDKYVSAADISWIWENRIGPDAPKRNANWNVMENKNWIMDRIVKNKGTLN